MTVGRKAAPQALLESLLADDGMWDDLIGEKGGLKQRPSCWDGWIGNPRVWAISLAVTLMGRYSKFGVVARAWDGHGKSGGRRRGRPGANPARALNGAPWRELWGTAFAFWRLERQCAPRPRRPAVDLLRQSWKGKCLDRHQSQSHHGCCHPPRRAQGRPGAHAGGQAFRAAPDGGGI